MQNDTELQEIDDYLHEVDKHLLAKHRIDYTNPESLLSSINHPKSNVASAAILLLGSFGRKRDAEYLKNIVTKSTGYRADSAMVAIAEISRSDDMDFYISQLNKRNISTLGAALHAIILYDNEGVALAAVQSLAEDIINNYEQYSTKKLAYGYTKDILEYLKKFSKTEHDKSILKGYTETYIKYEGTASEKRRLKLSRLKEMLRVF